MKDKLKTSFPAQQTAIDALFRQYNY